MQRLTPAYTHRSEISDLLIDALENAPEAVRAAIIEGLLERITDTNLFALWAEIKEAVRS